MNSGYKLLMMALIDGTSRNLLNLISLRWGVPKASVLRVYTPRRQSVVATSDGVYERLEYLVTVDLGAGRDKTVCGLISVVQYQQAKEC